ncbi:MAG: Uma2 family endonuclease [Acidobacteriota bacterium]
MAQPQTRFSPQEYLAHERAAATRSEYLDGQIFTLAGASRRHNLITLNLGAELRAQLRRRPCEVYTSAMRVKIPATGLYTYPDVVAVCGEPSFEDSELDTLLNPTLLIEVLSKSTADRDRGGKFEHYRSIDSVQEVLFVAQDRVHVMRYERQPDSTWLLSETRDGGGRMALSSIAAELDIAEVYAKVRFDDVPRPTPVPGPEA